MQILLRNLYHIICTNGRDRGEQQGKAEKEGTHMCVQRKMCTVTGSDNVSLVIVMFVLFCVNQNWDQNKAIDDYNTDGEWIMKFLCLCWKWFRFILVKDLFAEFTDVQEEVGCHFWRGVALFLQKEAYNRNYIERGSYYIHMTCHIYTHTDTHICTCI